MQGFDDVVAQAGRSSAHVLIVGEPGVGKKETARTIHRISRRAASPLLTLDCSAPVETIRGALFGYERDPETGTSAGLLEIANGGTVFLSEVGALDPAAQVVLMRALETQEIVPRGTNRAGPIPVNVRYIAGTTHDFESNPQDAKLRLDLLHQLSRLTLRIPPLRERVPEIAGIARQLVARACKQTDRSPAMLSDGFLRALQRYAWPGNISELKRVIERALSLSVGLELLLAHLGRDWPPPALSPLPLPVSPPDEGARINAALSACAGSKERAAKFLNLNRAELVANARRLDLLKRRRQTD